MKNTLMKIIASMMLCIVLISSFGITIPVYAQEEIICVDNEYVKIAIEDVKVLASMVWVDTEIFNKKNHRISFSKTSVQINGVDGETASMPTFIEADATEKEAIIIFEASSYGIDNIADLNKIVLETTIYDDNYRAIDTLKFEIVKGKHFLVQAQTTAVPQITAAPKTETKEKLSFRNGITYGMTKAEVKKIEQSNGETPDIETETLLHYEYVNIGVDESAQLKYVFEDGKLVEAYYYWWIQGHNYETRKDTVWNSLSNSLQKKYGVPLYANKGSTGYVMIEKDRDWSESFDLGRDEPDIRLHNDILYQYKEWFIEYSDGYCDVLLSLYRDDGTTRSWIQTLPGYYKNYPYNAYIIELKYKMMTTEQKNQIDQNKKMKEERNYSFI